MSDSCSVTRVTRQPNLDRPLSSAAGSESADRRVLVAHYLQLARRQTEFLHNFSKVRTLLMNMIYEFEKSCLIHWILRPGICVTRLLSIDNATRLKRIHGYPLIEGLIQLIRLIRRPRTLKLRFAVSRLCLSGTLPCPVSHNRPLEFLPPPYFNICRLRGFPRSRREHVGNPSANIHSIASLPVLVSEARCVGLTYEAPLPCP
jgi:hypothetical protein